MSLDLEVFSDRLKMKASLLVGSSIPYLRRILRFLALPYCFSRVNWQECTKSKFQVAKDFVFIFFSLKYFPDNYSPCRLWEKSRAEWIYYYGSNYDPYQRRRLRKAVQPAAYEILFQDKVVSEMLCNANQIPTPKVVRIAVDGESIESVAKDLRIQGLDQLIFKPRCGKGGGGIVCTKFQDGVVQAISGGREVSTANLNVQGEMVVQEFLKQHRDMNRVSSSTNTIRVVTIRKKNGDVVVVGTYARFGIGSSKVDNLSQGGICVVANISSGLLGTSGFDRLSRVFEVHPTSGVVFNGYQIPLWDEVINLAKRVQNTFSFYQLLGMDIAIKDEGPVVIEINSGYDNIDLEQARGPILKDPEVYKAYKEYDLFINKYQRNLKHNQQGS
jgi:glutathione synthase/RimK-type ligase-like ATP-grasp enzyme